MSDHLTADRTALPTATWRRLYPVPQTEEEWEQYHKEAKAWTSSGGGRSSFGTGLAIGVALGGRSMSAFRRWLMRTTAITPVRMAPRRR